MIKPIPKRFLPHNAIYKPYLGNTGEGDSWGEDALINFIKMEEKMQLKVTSNGREVIGNAKMFYDLVNSSGLIETPVENSIITYNNKNYKIVNVDVLCADSVIPHHYEVLLK